MTQGPESIDGAFREACKALPGSNDCSRCLGMAKAVLEYGVEPFSTKISGPEIERAESGLQARIEETSPPGTLNELSCDDRGERGRFIAKEALSTLTGPIIIREISEAREALHSELQNTEIVRVATGHGPVMVDELSLATRQTEAFKQCVEEYGWPDESDTILRYSDGQYPGLQWDNATFRRILLGKEPSREGEPERGFGQLTSLVTLSPRKFEGFSDTYHHDALVSRPALARLHAVAPDMLASINQWLEIEAVSGGRRNKPHNLQVFDRIMDRELVSDNEKDQPFTTAVKMITLMMIRLVKVADYEHDEFQGADKNMREQKSFNALDLALS